MVVVVMVVVAEGVTEGVTEEEIGVTEEEGVVGGSGEILVLLLLPLLLVWC